MNRTTPLKTLSTGLERRGIRAKIVSLRRLEDLEKEIKGKHAGGVLDDVLYRKQLAQFEFCTPETLSAAASIVITAAPQPQERVTFTRGGRLYPLLIPPTYSHHTDRWVQKRLEEVLRPRGYRVEKATLPLKYLAVSCGLAQYGRNNISYIKGLGSFFRLKAFFSDWPCEENAWHEPRGLEACEHCRACGQSCPTGAISGDRFLLHAEKCLTYHNEDEDPFPEWLSPAWHHCLVGCMKCQWACPENQAFKDWIEGRVVFDAEETELLSKGAPKEKLPTETVVKIEKTGLADSLNVLPRNMNVLFSRRKKDRTDEA